MKHNALTKVNILLRGIWFYFWGHIFAFFFYDKRYLTGKWFKGRFNGLCAVGWRWVTYDALERLRTHVNVDARFPVSSSNRVICPENIKFDPDDLNNFQTFGVYFQANGIIKIGKGTFIGPNVGLITANHDPAQLNDHLSAREIYIGDNCWIGMNAVILPGVTLGNNTTVGAGAVVTKSFPDGHCVIAGNPAKIIKYYERS